MALRLRDLLQPPRFEPPPLLRFREERYRRLLLPFCFLGLASIAMLGAALSVPEFVFGALASGLLGSFAIAVIAVSSNRRALAMLLVAGAVFALAVLLIPTSMPASLAMSGGAGLGAMAVLALWFARATEEERAPLRTVLVPCAFSALLFMTGVSFLTLTIVFIPRVLDSFVYGLDTTLGVHSFDVGRLYARVPWFSSLSGFVYHYILIGVFLVYLRQLADPRARGDIFLAAALASPLAIVVFFAIPVIGPVLAFAKEFPTSPPPASALILRPLIGFPAPRNCVPSMHNGWAILMVWHARPYGRLMRAATWTVLAITAISTLGFGYHYVFDIVVAVPFVLAIDALTTPVARASFRVRRRAIIGGAAITFGWFVAIRFGTPFLLGVRPLAPLLAVASTVVSLFLHRALDARAIPFSEAPPEARRHRDGSGWLVPILRTGIGFTAVTCAVTFARVARLALGSAPSGTAMRALGLAAIAVAASAAARIVGARTRASTASGADARASFASLTLGAAMGSVVTAFVIVPSVGSRDTIALSAFAALVLGLAAYLRSRRTVAASEAPVVRTALDRSRARLGALVVAAAGALALGVAAIYAHLIALVIGDGADVAAMMLSASFAGLTVGAWFLRARSARVVSAAQCAASLALALLTTNALWSRVPNYFASFAGYGFGLDFGEREILRYGMCLLLCVPPAACVGGLTVVGASLVGARRGAWRVDAIGVAGALVGWRVVAWMLPRLGSHGTLEALAAIAATVACALGYACRGQPGDAARRTYASSRRILIALGAAIALVGGFVSRGQFDFDRLASAASTDFAHPSAGHVSVIEESLAGGVVTVTQSSGPIEEARSVFVDGIRAGDARLDTARTANAIRETSGRDRALVVGDRVGASTRSLLAAGFKHVDVEEGRDFLASSPDRFDLIAIDPPNLWSRDAPTLYTREAYELARAHLTDAGVLEQRLPLARVQVDDVVSILATARSVFPQVALYEHGAESALIACAKACTAPDEASREPLLSPSQVDALVRDLGANTGGDIDALLLRDDDSALAITAAKANDLETDKSHAVVKAALARYAHAQ